MLLLTWKGTGPSFQSNHSMHATSVTLTKRFIMEAVVQVLDWSQFSIRVPEAEWDTIPALLRMVPPPLIEEMQRKVVHVYNTYFRSKRDVLNVALGIVEAKLCPPQNHCE